MIDTSLLVEIPERGVFLFTQSKFEQCEREHEANSHADFNSTTITYHKFV